MADAPAAAPAKPVEQPATDGEVRSNGPSEVCGKAILPQGYVSMHFATLINSTGMRMESIQ